MPSTTTYDPGDVLLMTVPFTDATAAKRRPALVVLDGGHEDVVVARITRQHWFDPQDVQITDWSPAGLAAPSFVRLHKLSTLEKTLGVRKLGIVTDADRARIRPIVQSLFASF